jgi:hypothetical protein
LSQSDGADLNEDLVEQPRVVELPGEVAAADDPDVHVARRLAHCGMNGPYIALHEADIRTWH